MGSYGDGECCRKPPPLAFHLTCPLTAATTTLPCSPAFLLPKPHSSCLEAPFSDQLCLLLIKLIALLILYVMKRDKRETWGAKLLLEWGSQFQGCQPPPSLHPCILALYWSLSRGACFLGPSPAWLSLKLPQGSLRAPACSAFISTSSLPRRQGLAGAGHSANNSKAQFSS